MSSHSMSAAGEPLRNLPSETPQISVHTKQSTFQELSVREVARRAVHDFKGMLTAGQLLLKLASKIETSHTISPELSERIASTAKRVDEIAGLALDFERSVGKTKKEKLSPKKQLKKIREKYAEFAVQVRARMDELHVEGGTIGTLGRSIKDIEGALDTAQSLIEDIASNRLDYSSKDLTNTKAPLDTTIETATLAFERGKKTIINSLQKKKEELLASLKFEGANPNEIELEIQKLEQHLDSIPKRKLLNPIINTERLSSHFSSPHRKTGPSSMALGTEITRIISNTLTNAVKYGGENTQFSANWDSDETSAKSGYLVLKFKDDGEGIGLDPRVIQGKTPKEVDAMAKKKLFPSKPTSGQESMTGSGFGGYNLHQVIDELGGSIAVRTKGGTIENGSEITFRIPLTIKEEETPEEVSKTAYESLTVHIDDMVFPDTQPSTEEMDQLKQSGMQVILLEDNFINSKLAQGFINKSLGLSSSSPKGKSAKLKAADSPRKNKAADSPRKGKGTMKPKREKRSNPPSPTSAPIKTESLLTTFSSGAGAIETNELGTPKIIAAIEKAIQSEKPVVLVLDNMAGEGPQGHQICASIRSWCKQQAEKHPELAQRYQQVQIYSFSGDSNMEPTEKALYDGCLIKPINPNSFTNSLIAALPTKRKSKRISDA